MSLKIRLSRGGAKKRPFYRIVIADSRMPRDGRFIEKIGTYNPLLPQEAGNRVVINEERAKYWLGVGAQLSDRVQVFFHRAGLVKEAPVFKTNNIGVSKKEAKKAASA